MGKTFHGKSCGWPMNSQIVTRSSSNTFERIMASLPGWMLILAGASMVAMVMLVPAWIDC